MVQVINTVDTNEVDKHDVAAVNKAENRPLYASRIKIHPEGRCRALSAASSGSSCCVLLGIYYVAPWLRWDRPGDAPDQAILIDLANRRFYFFFIEIWPQEFYYVAGPADHGGRRPVPRHLAVRPRLVRLCLPADRVDRSLHLGRKQDRGRPQCPHQARCSTLERLQDRQARASRWPSGWRSPSPPAASGSSISPTRQPCSGNWSPARPASVAYFTIAILTATTFTFAGFMREQVCTYMCPWPRIQGAMLDEESLDRHLQCLARRTPPRRPQEGRGAGPEGRRLRRLQRLRRRLPDGHRHPRRQPARMHQLRAVHRCLRHGDGQDRPPQGPHQLHDVEPLCRQCRGQERALELDAPAAPAHRDLFQLSGPPSASPCW